SDVVWPRELVQENVPEILFEQGDQTVKENIFTISGTVFDGDVVTIKRNGGVAQPLTLTEQDGFNEQVLLTPGVNTFEIIAKNNTSQMTVSKLLTITYSAPEKQATAIKTKTAPDIDGVVGDFEWFDAEFSAAE